MDERDLGAGGEGLKEDGLEGGGGKGEGAGEGGGGGGGRRVSPAERPVAGVELREVLSLWRA